MANRKKTDLAGFESFMAVQHGLSKSTITTYTTLVRGLIHRTNLSPETLISHTQSLPGNSAALSRTAWRLFCEYTSTLGYDVPNPFGSGFRSNSSHNLYTILSSAGVQQHQNGQPQTPARLATPAGTRPTPPPKLPAMLEMPPEVEKAVRKFLHRNPGLLRVLHRLRWDWTMYNEFISRWQTAFPGEKVETWIYVDREFLDIIGNWGYGEETPKSGYFIPKAYQSTEPVPDFVLRSLFGDEK
jgi:hypothetical protein